MKPNQSVDSKWNSWQTEGEFSSQVCWLKGRWEKKGKRERKKKLRKRNLSNELVDVLWRFPVALDPVENEVTQKIDVGFSQHYLLASCRQYFHLDERQISDHFRRRHRRYLNGHTINHLNITHFTFTSKS